ncbi:MAG: hypothetical protein ACI9U2_001280 [Bradymonadia bacterium]|jgi:hypothetical protein
MKLIFALCLLFAAPVAAQSVDHSPFDVLLKACVKGDMVNYQGFVDQPTFKAYLEMIGKTDPATLKTPQEQLAFWINAYNAHTINAVLAHWPKIASVGEVYPDFGFFKRAEMVVGGKKYALNDIENKIIRPTFKDPRIHAALNCASISCPPLAGSAFHASTLDSQLDQVMGAFINDAKRNQIGADGVQLSEIFNWYKDDFKAAGGAKAYFKKFLKDPAKIKALDAAPLKFMPYNWNLNKI